MLTIEDKLLPEFYMPAKAGQTVQKICDLKNILPDTAIQRGKGGYYG